MEDGLLGFLEETTTKQLCLVQQRRVCSLSAAVYFLSAAPTSPPEVRQPAASSRDARPPARPPRSPGRRIFFLALACLLHAGNGISREVGFALIYISQTSEPASAHASSYYRPSLSFMRERRAGLCGVPAVTCSTLYTIHRHSPASVRPVCLSAILSSLSRLVSATPSPHFSPPRRLHARDERPPRSSATPRPIRGSRRHDKNKTASSSSSS